MREKDFIVLLSPLRMMSWTERKRDSNACRYTSSPRNSGVHQRTSTAVFVPKRSTAIRLLRWCSLSSCCGDISVLKLADFLHEAPLSLCPPNRSSTPHLLLVVHLEHALPCCSCFAVLVCLSSYCGRCPYHTGLLLRRGASSQRGRWIR